MFSPRHLGHLVFLTAVEFGVVLRSISPSGTFDASGLAAFDWILISDCGSAISDSLGGVGLLTGLTAGVSATGGTSTSMGSGSMSLSLATTDGRGAGGTGVLPVDGLGGGPIGFTFTDGRGAGVGAEVRAGAAGGAAGRSA